MELTSLYFLLFALCVAIAYFIVPKKIRWVVLLIASYAFYWISSPKTLAFMVFTTVVTFLGGLYLGRQNKKHKAYLAEHGQELSRDEKKALKTAVRRKKKWMVLLILILNFGILAMVKYFRYYIEALGFANLKFDLGILIPLGISFYTFQSVAYIIDLYRDKFDADRNVFKFALFLSFFPLLIQGPISRYDQLAGQLYEGHPFRYRNLAFGAQLILWGFFKKLVIADRAGIFVSTVFDHYGEYEGCYVILALLLYSVQIYGDFSGGIDISRGVAQILGIELTKNFERPYFSDSISEFWRRWHITLGNWCRDYIFYPISLSKGFGKVGKALRKVLGDRLGKLFPVIVAQLATFLVIGIWHGAEFKYVAYGLYNGGIIILGLIFAPLLDGIVKILRINTEAFSWRLFQIGRTFFLIVLGRILPRAASFGVAIAMCKSMLVFNPGSITEGGIFNLGLSPSDFSVLGLCCAIWFCISLMQENGWRIREALARQNMLFRWAIYLMAFAAVLVFGIYGPGYDAAAFIYRGF